MCNMGLEKTRTDNKIMVSNFCVFKFIFSIKYDVNKLINSDGQSRTRWKSTAWHPSAPTQLCIASEDDQYPVIQLWDLRYCII